ncbi:thiamine ABC transporter substrate binding subunit [Microvirga arabica]|uniref:thiamine ABC transporter substrate binding subunit n=1 Tax=Microvirga arabica TaxID=1128671 RepID=UPI00193AB12D|nr:thiamine ABC transporter substrate binding subunit [Microvirga arabica]MBM1171697.1 thiamine ABC transporter substrate binding subunit [Microvirga arabica]
MYRRLLLTFVSLGLATGIAQAQTKPTLTVYTYSSFASKYGPAKTVEERFEATCNCDVTWVTAEDAGSLLGRLRLEGQNTKADAVVGLDMNLVAEAKSLNLFAPHGTEVKDLSLPIEWKDDTFIPFDWGYYAFVYDANKLPNTPKSLKELVDNPNGPKVVLQDPRTSAPGLGLLLWMQKVYGEKAGEAWGKLKPRIVTFTKGWSEAYGLFMKGEADMVMSYTTSPAYHIVAEKKDNYKAAAFTEGHYLHVELAGMTRTTKQPELAKQFMAFILSEGFQTAIPETNWMYPAKNPPSGTPEALKGMIQPSQALLFTPEEVQQNRRAFTDVWLNATAR